MANILNMQIINEGSQKAVIHWYMESDGNEGEFQNKVMLDPVTDFAVPVVQQFNEDRLKLPPSLTILELWSSTAWFDITLGFDGINPAQGLPYPMVTIARDADFYMDFRGFGGIKDRTPYTVQPTGKLLISTRDFAPLGSTGFLVLTLRKN